MQMIRRLGKLFHDDRGATAVEYGLILALVVLVMLAALLNVAGTTIDMWNDVADRTINA
jgi:pilus assembly protein Flp/PilA